MTVNGGAERSDNVMLRQKTATYAIFFQSYSEHGVLLELLSFLPQLDIVHLF
jgi:hypothetical protein